MGSISVSGLDTLCDDFSELARLPSSVIEDILNAEAEVIVPAQQEEIAKSWTGPYTTGVSTKSVKKGKPKRTSSGSTIEITFSGSRRRGRTSTRNAEIAFINEYGKKGQPARPAIQTANKRKESDAIEAGEKAYNKYIDSKNL